MGIATVIVSFVVCILINVFLNSFDVYSDTTLIFNTLTFNLGSSFILTGCRVCHHKDDGEILSRKNQSCSQCWTKNSQYWCGASAEMLDKSRELENKQSCENEYYAFQYNVDTSKSLVFRKGKCNQESDFCCLHSAKHSNISSSLDHLDKRILAHYNHRIDNEKIMGYDHYVLSGRLSNLHCQTVFWNYFTYWNPARFAENNFREFISSKVSILQRPNQREIYFKFVNSNNSTLIENGFSYKDGCGILVKDKQDNSVQHNGEKTCGTDLCRLPVSIQTFLQLVSF